MVARINTQNRPKSDVAIMFKLLENFFFLLEQEVDSKALCAVFQQKHDQSSSLLTTLLVSLMSHRLSLSQNDGGRKGSNRERSGKEESGTMAASVPVQPPEREERREERRV